MSKNKLIHLFKVAFVSFLFFLFMLWWFGSTDDSLGNGLFFLFWLTMFIESVYRHAFEQGQNN